MKPKGKARGAGGWRSIFIWVPRNLFHSFKYKKKTVRTLMVNKWRPNFK